MRIHETTCVANKQIKKPWDALISTAFCLARRR
jgi:hypothetical protein